MESQMKVQETGEDSRSQTSSTVSLSELRIVLLGFRFAGKSSAGNKILGCKRFELKRTAQCVTRQGEVAGRRITVVEAPGWFVNQTFEGSTEFSKQEIVLSVTKCPPGPHCLLLVINVGSKFKAKQRKAVEKHLKLFPERVWSHTLVLFTHGDWLRDTPIEQHIKIKGEDLQWLVEKCGNRYHVLNNMNRSDKTQVTELLEKIEKMVAANSGGYFEIDRRILQEVEEKRRTEVERAETRRMKVQKQREDIRAKIG
uniref:AIG1-type G domain-containing protein n=1 Tax=Astyanax mexicanus TaxID=7994 RepID=A0A3B1J5Z5_ASTMX